MSGLQEMTGLTMDSGYSEVRNTCKSGSRVADKLRAPKAAVSFIGLLACTLISAQLRLRKRSENPLAWKVGQRNELVRQRDRD